MPLNGRRIAVLVENFYEDLELWYPVIRMREAGAEVKLLGTGKQRYSGKHGLPATEDMKVDDASADHFEAVIIPGGYSPDHMRRHPPLLDFVREMFRRGRIIAMICHAGWVPASAGILGGRTVTSFYSIRDDLENAGADWIDKPVVRDGNLISSRTPDDLPLFCRTIIEALSEA